MTLKQDLKKLQNEINKLEKNLVKLTKAIAAAQKPKSRKAPKPKPVRAKAPKETRGEAAKAKMTATDQVLDIIRKADTGVDASTLIKKTGFKDQKVRNILTRIFKEGRVKRVGRGVYVVAEG